MQSIRVKTSDKIELHVETLGQEDSPVLIFSNSLGTNLEMWRHQANALQDRYRIILYDTRGHGQSDAPSGDYSISRLSLDVIDIMDELGVQRAHFCGLSLGGMTGQALATRVPERFYSFVLAATSAYMGPPAGWQSRIETVRNKGMAVIVDAVLERWFAPQGFVDPDIANLARGWLLETNPVGYAGCCAAIRDLDLRAVAHANPISTLVLSGKDDLATPPNHAGFLQAEMPNAEIELLSGGHLLNLEQPEAFTNAVAEFCRKLKRAHEAI